MLSFYACCLLFARKSNQNLAHVQHFYVKNALFLVFLINFALKTN